MAELEVETTSTLSQDQRSGPCLEEHTRMLCLVLFSLLCMLIYFERTKRVRMIRLERLSALILHGSALLTSTNDMINGLYNSKKQRWSSFCDIDKRQRTARPPLNIPDCWSSCVMRGDTAFPSNISPPQNVSNRHETRLCELQHA